MTLSPGHCCSDIVVCMGYFSRRTYVRCASKFGELRFSVSSEEMDQSTEADGEVQIVTECWVEPQFGCCVNNPRERIHLDGLTCEDLPTAVSSVSSLSFY